MSIYHVHMLLPVQVMRRENHALLQRTLLKRVCSLWWSRGHTVRKTCAKNLYCQVVSRALCSTLWKSYLFVLVHLFSSSWRLLLTCPFVLSTVGRTDAGHEWRPVSVWSLYADQIWAGQGFWEFELLRPYGLRTAFIWPDFQSLYIFFRYVQIWLIYN